MDLLSKFKWWKSSAVAPTGAEIYVFDLPQHGRFYADPLVIRRGLLLVTSGRCWEWAGQARLLEQNLDKCAEGDDVESIASRAEFSMQLADIEGKLAEAAFQAFGLPKIDKSTGQGISEAVALGLLQDYLGWVEEKKEQPEE